MACGLIIRSCNTIEETVEYLLIIFFRSVLKMQMLLHWTIFPRLIQGLSELRRTQKMISLVAEGDVLL